MNLACARGYMGAHPFLRQGLLTEEQLGQVREYRIIFGNLCDGHAAVALGFVTPEELQRGYPSTDQRWDLGSPLPARVPRIRPHWRAPGVIELRQAVTVH
jgi:hypothetical protein